MMERPPSGEADKPRPIVIPLTNEQKGLAILERIEALLVKIADNTRPSGTKAINKGKI